MVILNCHSTAKPQTPISPDNSSPHSHPPINNNNNNNNKLSPKISNDKSYPQPQKLYIKKVPPQQRRPSVVEIERALGAGVFRDRDINREEGDGLFDNMLRNSVGKNEGDAERKLRETGEWLIDLTEKNSRSAGKQILMTMFVWILPLWIFAFLFASGIVQLPFHNTFLDDLFS